MDVRLFDREISQAGPRAQDRRTLVRQGKRWEAEQRVCNLLKDEAEWLLDRTQSVPDNARAVVSELLEKLGREPNAEMARLSGNFLIREIDKGNRAGYWEIPVPAQTLRRPLPRPPICAQTFPNIARIDRLREALIKAMEDPQFPTPTRNGKNRRLTKTDLGVGVGLLCSVIFGGICRRDRLVSLALVEGSSFHAHGEVYWIDWPEVSKESGGIQRWTRWYPDPVSGLIIGRLHRDQQFPLIPLKDGQRCEKEIWRRCEAVLNLLPVETEDCPRSFKQLFDWMKTWLYYFMPPCLAAYAVGKIDSVSMTPEAHARTLFGLSILDEAQNDEDRLPFVVKDPRTVIGRVGEGQEDLLKLRKALRATLSDKPKTKIHARARIEKFMKRTDLSPAFLRLAEWTRDLCSQRSGTAASVRLSTVTSYLTRVDTRLAVVLEERDPATFDSDELQALFSEILDGTKQRSASQALVPLASFHRYLVGAHGVPVDVGSVFEDRGVEGAVDASQVAEREYLWVLSKLGDAVSHQPAWLVEMQRAALILGFRTMARRGEVRRLRVGDICGKDGVLYIRNTKEGQVKSAAGVRNLRIAGFVPEPELVILREFVDSRIRQITGDHGKPSLLSPINEEYQRVWSRPLFEDPESSGQLIGEKALFDTPREMLATLCGDSSVHFHRMRKGGNNLVFLLLMEEELPGCSTLFDSTGAGNEAAQRLLVELLGHSGPDQRKLWVLTGNMGHASPVTTLGSYLMCLDWLLYYALQRRTPKLTDRLLAAGLDLSENSIRVHKSKTRTRMSDIISWLAYKNENWRRRITLSISPPDESAKHGVSCTKLDGPPLGGQEMLQLLSMAMDNGDQAEAKIRRSGISPEVVRPWIRMTAELKKLVGKSNAWQHLSSTPEGRSKQFFAHGLCISRKLPTPRPLLQKFEIRNLNQWTLTLHDLALRHPRKVAGWLTTFWENRDARSHEIRFQDSDEARDFLSMLREIVGNSSGDIRFRHYPSSQDGVASAESQVRSWCDALDLAELGIETAETVVRQRSSSRLGTLGITMTVHHKLSAETLVKHQNTTEKRRIWRRRASVALEGACYVLTVWMLSGLYQYPNGTYLMNSGTPETDPYGE